MSEIIDKGSWLYGAALVVVVSGLLQFGVTSRLYRAFEAVPVADPQHRAQPSTKHPPAEDDVEDDHEPTSRRLPFPVVGNLAWSFVSFSSTSVIISVVGLGLLYVPLTLFLVNLFEHQGSFGVILQRDYGALLTCTLMAWAAAHLPVSVAGIVLNRLGASPIDELALWLLAKVAFGVFMVCALRTLFGVGYGVAAAAVSLSWVSVLFESSLGFFASPFIIYFGYSYFQGDIGDILSGFRTRQGFRRYLEAATINPHDAEAHYQLGLLHLQRRQYSEAVARFKRAVEIDPNELDAHFQLGRVARMHGKLDDALEHLNAVTSLDQEFSQSEVWREIGEVHAAASRNEEARTAFEHFAERRPYDPEGLYYFGATLAKLGEAQRAREVLNQCVEAERTNPYYRHGQMRKWRKLAEKQLRSLK